MNNLLKYSDVAKILQCSVITVRKIPPKDLPRIRISHTFVRFDPADVNHYIHTNRKGSNR